MGKFDSQYFFILRSRDKRMPEMTPDEDTSRKPYTSQILPLHTKPLVFHNGLLDYQQANRISPADPPPDILFDGSDILVKDDLREKLLPLDIPNLAIQPAIYIDHNNKWHEDRWYLTFLELFDCWDRDNSNYRHRDFEPDEEPRYNVRQYSLNDQLLDKTPIEARRLFKMGGTLDGFVVAHASVARYFGLSGATLVPIAEFGVTFP